MRSIIYMYRYCFLFLALLIFAACKDLYNSDLIGKWQLKTVEKDGEETVVDTVWYNFQSMHVFQLQIYVPQQDTVLLLDGVRTQDDDALSTELATEAHLDYTDWPGRNRTFTIDRLDKKMLVLRSEEGYSYSFIRF